jgi:hypothetical protein
MKIWKFFAVPASGTSRFGWRWREENQGRPARESEKAFDLYFDCVQDARDNGYSGPNPRPEPFGAIGECPGGGKR